MNTPNLQALADNGLRYTHFHTTAICSPTRASLLTGRNSHSAHMGLFPETAVNFPGYDARIPFEKAFISEVLRENGYNTFAVGKWHLTPVNEVTQAGPFNRWPTGRGFDKYFGFLYGETDQYNPWLVEGTETYLGNTKGKHFTTLITDKAITYISNQKSTNPENHSFCITQLERATRHIKWIRYGWTNTKVNLIRAGINTVKKYWPTRRS